MRAVVFHSPGLDNLRLEDLPRPQPGPGEVLIRVRYMGVNPIDHAVVSGSYKVSPMPHIPGCEFAGVVEEVGPGRPLAGAGNHSVIDGVLGILDSRPGGMQACHWW
jgi:NADPH:quinone reductase and related Zn-dependent oxidoreductases